MVQMSCIYRIFYCTKQNDFKEYFDHRYEITNIKNVSNKKSSCDEAGTERRCAELRQRMHLRHPDADQLCVAKLEPL